MNQSNINLFIPLVEKRLQVQGHVIERSPLEVRHRCNLINLRKQCANRTDVDCGG